MLAEVKHTGDRIQLIYTVWADRNRRFFISNTGTSAPGKLQKRVRLQARKEAQNVLPESYQYSLYLGNTKMLLAL